MERLRYTTSHPRDMTDDLIAAHRDEAKLMPYLHLPFQSGADRILAAMNRKHTSADYLSLVERIRAARPDIALSTDIIVGFPGETEARLRGHAGRGGAGRLRAGLLLQVQPPAGHAGRRHGAGSRGRQNRAAATPPRRRCQAANGVQSELRGQSLPVLFDRPGRRPGQLVGRSPYLQAVHVQGDNSLIGCSLEVEIRGAGPNSLAGTIVGGAP